MPAKQPDGDRRLEVLLADYVACRDDNRQHQVQLVALLTVGVSLLAISYGIIFQAAPFNTASNAMRLNPALIFSLPIIPLVVLSYTAAYVAGMTMRGYYMRALEREIATQSGATLKFHSKLPAPSLGHLDIILQRTGPEGQPRIRLMNNFIGLVPFLGFVGLIALCVIALKSWPLRVSCALLYLPFMVLVFWVGWTTSIKPRNFFSKLYAQLPYEFKRPLAQGNAARSPERHLWSYLLIPRLGEVSKGIGYLYVAGIFFFTFRSPASSIRYIFIFWISLEIFTYQARYAWNDLRGLEHDSLHPAKRARGRIPQAGTLHGRVLLIEAMIAIRLGAAIGLVWLLPTGIDRYAAATFLLALCIIAIMYEGLRSTFSGYSDPAAKQIGIKEWLIYIAVSLGYGIRGSAGAWFGSNGRIPLFSEIVAFLASAASGGAAVLIIWLYEANLVHTTIQAGPSPVMPIASRIPDHLAGLLGVYYRSHAGRGPTGRQLLKRDGHPFSPWGIFMMAATALSAVLGADLWLTYTPPTDYPQAFVFTGALAAGIFLGYLIQRLPATMLIGVPFATILATFLILLHLGWRAALLSVLPVLVSLILYITLRFGEYEHLIEGIVFTLKQVTQLAVDAKSSLQRLVLGAATMTALDAERDKRKGRKRGS